MPSPLTLSRTIRSDSHLHVRKLLHFCMRVRWCRATFLIMGCRTQLVDADGNVNVRQKDCSGLKSDFLGIAITKPDFRSSPRTVGDGNPNSHCSRLPQIRPLGPLRPCGGLITRPNVVLMAARSLQSWSVRMERKIMY